MNHSTHSANKSMNFGPGFRCLLFLAMLYFTLNIVGAVLVYKLISIGPVLGPGGLAVLPLVFLIEDIVAEIFGYKVSRFLVWLVLFSSLLFCVSVLIIVHLPSPPYWHLQADYNAVFDPIMRTAPSALIAIFTGRFINIYLITKWKILAKGQFFWLRCILATIFGSIVALSIFFFFAFWGSVPFSALERLFLSDFFVRVSYSVIGSFPATILVNYLKHKLKIDVYDYHTNFNPFKLDTKI